MTAVARRPDTRPAPPGVAAGALAMLPMAVAYAPFGVIVGTAVAAHGSALAGWSGSWLIYGGSAHLATLRTMDEAGPVVAVLTALLVNARLLVYSAGLAQTWRDQPRWFKVAAAGLIIDPTFALAQGHAAGEPDPTAQRRYFVVAGLTLGTVWSAAVAAGALLGPRLDWLDIGIVVPLCLVAVLGDALRESEGRRVVAVAATVALLTASWPAGTGLLAAIVAGIVAGRAGRAGTGEERVG
jgi:predicted branched-subunit amino acid permease